MAVVVVGKDPAQVLTATCRGCASILQYVRSDVQERIVRDYTGDAESFHFINCPCCNKEVPARKY